jgi:hypothetical protein
VQSPGKRNRTSVKKTDAERLEIQVRSLRDRISYLGDVVSKLEAEVFALRTQVDALQSHKRAVWWRLWT